jgi:Uma2 family endonuclease
MEVQSEIRHEFRGGEIIPMTGGLPNHNQIAGNIYAVLNFAFRGKPYRAFVTDQRLWIPRQQIYTYPDVMVIEGELQLQTGRKDTVMNPLLIVEVLSTSTQNYDRGNKFLAYRTIPSFQEYILVDQYSQCIEHYVKVNLKQWTFQEYDETDTVVKLSVMNLELAIADIYDKVTFEPEEAESSEDGN